MACIIQESFAIRTIGAFPVTGENRQYYRSIDRGRQKSPSILARPGIAVDRSCVDFPCSGDEPCILHDDTDWVL
jgi:hypothetical protein